MTEEEKKPDKKWEFYLTITKEYCPEAYHILSTVTAAESYTIYCIEENEEQELMGKLAHIVHEACHGLNEDIARLNNTKEGYYIDPGKTIAVSHGEVFNSKELNTAVPKSVQKKIFRYNNYIGGNKGLSSQVSGIYGLMDEFSAYYHSALCEYKTKQWYEKKFGYSDPEPWIKNNHDIGGRVMAFYEFSLFIAWYLQYAEQKYPDQYKSIMADTKLREAFSLLYVRFENLAQLYEKEVYSLEKILKEKGFEVSIEKVSFFFYKDGNGTGYGHYLGEIETLKKFFTTEIEAILTALKKY